MNKAFEKILERLEEATYRIDDSATLSTRDVVNEEDAKEIVQEVAEEFATDTNVGNNGWITCSEMLPEDDSICIVTVEYPNNKIMVDYGWFDRKRVCWFVGMQEFITSNILAWQPLPEPFKESD